MKKNTDANKISRYISEFLYVYAPDLLTSSEHTLKSYRDAITLYILFLESEDIQPISFNRKNFEKDYIERWCRWMKEIRKCSPDTCNVRLSSLKVFLKFLGHKEVEYMYLYHSAKEIKRQKCMKKKVHGFTKEAVTAILAQPDLTTKTGKRDIVFLTLLYATAARLDEIRSIKITHIHLHTIKPYVNLQGKGNKTRTAYLLPRAVAHIEAYLKEFHDEKPDLEAYLFYSRVGGKYTKLSEPALDKRIKIYAKQAHEKCINVPLNAHAHQFRHARATHWLEEGINIVQISYLLGHEQLETTMRYLDITMEDKVKALSTLEGEEEKAISKKWKKADGKLLGFCGLKH